MIILRGQGLEGGSQGATKATVQEEVLDSDSWTTDPSEDSAEAGCGAAHLGS